MGVLLYVSLFERMASIIADQAVINAMRESGQDDRDVLQSAVDALTADLAEQDITTALVTHIQSLAPRIAVHLPATGAGSDEIPDALVFID